MSETGQRFVFDMGSGQYKHEIARARTFGFTKDVEMMRSRGLGARRQPRQRGRRRRVQGAQQRRPALRRRVRQAQDPRRDRRHGARRPAAAGRVHAPSSRATRSTTGCVRALLADRSAWEIVTFDDEATRAGRPRRAGARVVSRAAARAAGASPHDRDRCAMAVTVLRWIVGGHRRAARGRRAGRASGSTSPSKRSSALRARASAGAVDPAARAGLVQRRGLGHASSTRIVTWK